MTDGGVRVSSSMPVLGTAGSQNCCRQESHALGMVQAVLALTTRTRLAQQVVLVFRVLFSQEGGGGALDRR